MEKEANKATKVGRHHTLDCTEFVELLSYNSSRTKSSARAYCFVSKACFARVLDRSSFGLRSFDKASSAVGIWTGEEPSRTIRMSQR